MASLHLTMDELNKAALEHFLHQPVSSDKIVLLAATKHQDLPPAQKSPELWSAIPVEEDNIPTLGEFITQLVVSSNVQVPTLMSTLVYLARVKSKLQPMARGQRCTIHRIFLASLILASKYLNDRSPKNKHWANHTHINTEMYSFGFTRTEVNMMEKQLLFLLGDAAEEEQRRRQEIYIPATHYHSPALPRGNSRSHDATPEHMRVAGGGRTYTSSGSSYASLALSSRQQSCSTTPLESADDAYVCETQIPRLFDSPVGIVINTETPKDVPVPLSMRMPPCKILMEQYHQFHENAAKKRHRCGIWGGLLAVAGAVGS
ncbi:cyclin domain-containing protein [Hirsutella rhossiliensis]|uniref:Cyclin domain-containing protein n=1 Tax=Hirsutella rhossiliensis TaxID=111463 RepID=A0A9P8SFY4_9HYPO|nr:cyclin domain-containing protein [Hirsutella rhossiliensis]KAH0961246.1 cyclin domain-containing protein [Hirsutella rhossiliensis]